MGFLSVFCKKTLDSERWHDLIFYGLQPRTKTFFLLRNQAPQSKAYKFPHKARSRLYQSELSLDC
jgi:hypothetical protein